MAIQFIGFPEEVLGRSDDFQYHDDFDVEPDPEFLKIVEEDMRHGTFDNPIESISGAEIARLINQPEEKTEVQVPVIQENKFPFPKPQTTISRASNIYRKGRS